MSSLQLIALWALVMLVGVLLMALAAARLGPRQMEIRERALHILRKRGELDARRLRDLTGAPAVPFYQAMAALEREGKVRRRKSINPQHMINVHSYRPPPR